EPGRVVVFSAETDDKMPPGVYRTGALEMAGQLRRPDFDPHDPALFIDYFTSLYKLVPEDRERIQHDREQRNYETVDKNFTMIENDTFPVVVRYGDAEKRARIIGDLRRSVGRPKAPVRMLMQRAQPYVVNCRRWYQQSYEGAGLIEEIVPGLWEWKGGYDEKLGLTDTRLEPAGLFV
ncbi:MAG: hypothetical protein WBA63_02045, partial [Thermomicrobiales bacterium]